MLPKWLEWGQMLQTIAQNGLAYCKNPFDIERFQQVREIAAQMLAISGEKTPEALLSIFTDEVGYATPKVDVRAALFVDNQIVLVRELLDNGRWTLPGGWADVTDSPSEAVLREIHEEAGYEAKVLKLAAVYDRNRHHPYFYFSTYKLFFLCEITGGAPTTSIETGGVGFFQEDALPELSVGRVTVDEIHMLFEHHRHPELPTIFD